MERPRPPLPSRAESHEGNAARNTSSQSKHVQLTCDARCSSRQDEEDGTINEQFPFLPARHGDDVGGVSFLSSIASPDATGAEWDMPISPQEETKSSWYLFLLTIAFGGLQIAWSVELSHGSPYLLSLGISKSLLAFVWIAGPLSGTLAQPYVGIKSDRCRSRFGKRRPFMLGGAIASILSLLVLAWTRELVGGFLGPFGISTDGEVTKNVIVVAAVLMIYILDFSINVIQAGIRAFVVDNAPTHQQNSANAWASRALGMGNIIGYLFGYANLPEYMWFFGKTQFQVLCGVASLAIATTLAISCFTVSERDPRLEGQPPKQEGGVIAFFLSLWQAMRRLPPQIKNVCLVQLAAWVGWFPFLFYITTYIGGLYVDPIFRANRDMSDEDIDEAWEHGTRMGTFALLVYATVSFVASVILPWFIISSYEYTEPPTNRLSCDDAYFNRYRASRHSRAVDAASALSVKPVTTSHGRVRNMQTSSLNIPGLTLKRAWLLSHIMFALLMWLTFLAQNTTFAIILVGLVGIPWAMTMWAPFALIAAEISKRDSIRQGFIPPPRTRNGEPLTGREEASDEADQAGVILGIHNVAIAAPQVIATLVSSVIFKALQKPRGTPGDDSVAWAIRFGGVLALVAAWLTRRIAEEGDDEETPPKW